MINEEDEHRLDRRERAQERDKAKFADYVQLHTIEGKVISRADERKILEQGLTRFNLDLREAQGILLSVASEREIALVSDVEHHVGNFLQLVAKRGKVARNDFNKAVQFYGKMAKDGIPNHEVRARIKEMIEQQGWTGKRRRWLFNSKRWFKKA